MEDVRGLPLPDALAELKKIGIETVIEYADPPQHGFSPESRTPRAVMLRGNVLVVSRFRDANPIG